MEFGFTDLLIAFYCWLAWSWNLPEDAPSRRLIRPLTRVIQWLGLWHDWRMFAPNPVSVNRRIIVRIDYADGTRREWRPPYNDNEGPWRSFLHARIRKFMECVLNGKPKTLRVSLASYVLSQLARMDLGADVVGIEIVNERWPISIDPATFDEAATPTEKVLYSAELPAGGTA
jgi:hypothetical protein